MYVWRYCVFQQDSAPVYKNSSTERKLTTIQLYDLFVKYERVILLTGNDANVYHKRYDLWDR